MGNDQFVSCFFCMPHTEANCSQLPVGCLLLLCVSRKSPKISGSQNGGLPEPYVRLFLGGGVSLKPYPYSVYDGGIPPF